MGAQTKNILWALVLVIIVSCTKHNEISTETSKPKGEQAEVVIPDSVAPPDILELSGKYAPIEVIAGEPEFHEIKMIGGKPAFTNYGVEQGYDISAVNLLYADDDGYLWFGTGKALFRYDGHTFQKFNESNGLVLKNGMTHIMQDKTGNIWICTWGDGIYKFDGKSFLNISKSDLIADSIILCSAQDNENNIWFGTLNNGLIKYDGKTFETIKTVDGPVGMGINHITTDSKGRLIVATDRGFSIYDGEKFRNYGTEDGLPSSGITHIYEDRSGNLWLSLGNDGVSVFDGKTFTNYSKGNGLSANYVKSIVQDNMGQYWILSYNGLYRFDGKSFTAYTEEHGLMGNKYFALTIDKMGKVWIGTHKGLSRYDGDIITQYTAEEGFPSAKINGISADKNNTIWIATADGLVKYPAIRASDNSIGFERYTTNQGLQDNNVNCVFTASSGNIWMGTAKGLTKYNGETFVHYPSAGRQGNQNVACISQDKKDRIWYSSYGSGVFCLDDNLILGYYSEQGLYADFMSGITKGRKGNMWFGSWPGVVSKYDGIHIINYSFPEQLEVASNFYLQEAQNGDLWISFMGRVTRFDGTTFMSASDIDGLSAGSYGQILEDTVNDVLWFGSNNGITSLKTLAGPESTKEYFSNYNYKNGYQILNAYVFCISDSGVLWYGSGDKLGRFDPNQLGEKTPVPIKITSLSINNDNICWDALLALHNSGQSDFQEGDFNTFCQWLSTEEYEKIKDLYSNIRFDSVSGASPIPTNPVLAFNQNNIKFEFSAISTSLGNSVRYQYMLDGYDREWSTLGTIDNASYAKVDPGKYVFRVKALSPFGFWSETFYAFQILPPWWKTWWAYGFYIFVFLVAIIAVDRIQRRRIHERALFAATEKELEQAKEIEKAYHQLKTTQSQLIHAEKMASLGELTAGIAHEIQNPLNFVKNFSEVNLELTVELQEKLEGGNIDELKMLANDIIENEQKIAQHGLRADAIVKGMLQHSRVGKGEKELTDINALAEEYLRLSYHGLRAKDKSFNADFRMDAEESLPQILVTPSEIGRVFLNLINNAFYAVSEQKRKLTVGYKPQIVISTKAHKDFVEIRVKDNGGGIPESIVDKIFQPFFTTKPTGEGTGLGLSMSYDIITKGHGGELRVESKVNVGCEFIILLPINPSLLIREV